MKKQAIIAYILAFALLLSACMYQIPQETSGSSDPALRESEGIPSESNATLPEEESASTQPTYYYTNWADITEPTFTEDEIIYTDNGIIAGPFTFEYVDDSWTFFYDEPATELKGLNLVYCQVDAEQMVIPSEVCGIPVVAIAYHHPWEAPLDQPIFFNGDVELKTLYITDSVLYIDDGAFYGCTKLEEVRLSHRITFLGAYDSDYGEDMFAYTSIKSIEIPEGVRILGHYTFDGAGVEQLVLPSTLTAVYISSFGGSLKDIYLRATAAHYPADLLEEIDEQTDATLYFYSETEPTEEGNFWHYVEGKPVIW